MMESWALIIVFLFSRSSVLSRGQGEIDDFLVAGRCKNVWRPDKLVGKCFGLRLHSKYPELAGIQKVESSMDCQSLCCNIGDKCVSWQFEMPGSQCKLGDVVRLGFEKNGKPNYCDPYPPSKWNGKQLALRHKSNGGANYDPNTCRWEPHTLIHQCFGLGDERLSKDGKRIIDPLECQEACCQAKDCNLWQQLPERGCYFGRDGRCGKESKTFQGGRKCIPHYCGGMEEEILGYKVEPRSSSTGESTGDSGGRVKNKAKNKAKRGSNQKKRNRRGAESRRMHIRMLSSFATNESISTGTIWQQEQEEHEEEEEKEKRWLEDWQDFHVRGESEQTHPVLPNCNVAFHNATEKI